MTKTMTNFRQNEGILEWFLSDGNAAFDHLDRYVNCGSPSGFSRIHRTSINTDPWGDSSKFHLRCIIDNPGAFEIYGESPNCELFNQPCLYIHPDMSDHSDLEGFDVTVDKSFTVSPTSSARTVRIHSAKTYDFVKLHYDGLIGRNKRYLYREKAISGPEMSKQIVNAIEEGVLPNNIAVLHEPACKIHLNPAIENPARHWCYIYREATPTTRCSEDIRFMIPMFSLWSEDRTGLIQLPILQLFASIWAKDTEQIIQQDILHALIDLHFSLICKLGFQFEFNAQNVLIGFNREFMPVALVLRDMMDIEKDLFIRHDIGLSCEFSSCDYHMLHLDDLVFAQKRRSFMLDFKLTQYVIFPLLDYAAHLSILCREKTITQLRKHVISWLHKLPDDYLPPDRMWYCYDRVLIHEHKKHIARTNPLLR